MSTLYDNDAKSLNKIVWSPTPAEPLEKLADALEARSLPPAGAAHHRAVAALAGRHRTRGAPIWRRGGMRPARIELSACRGTPRISSDAQSTGRALTGTHGAQYPTQPRQPWRGAIFSIGP